MGGKVGIWKQARELVIISEPTSTGTLHACRRSYSRWYSLGLMQTSLRSCLSPLPHGRHIKDERKEIRLGSLTLDSSSHQIEDAAFTPAAPQDSQHPRANTDSQLTHHATHESKTKYTLLYAKEHSAQPGMFWRTHHTKPDPKSMRVMPLCFWGV